MKKLFILLSLFAALILSFSSCTKNSKDNLSGTWNFNAVIENYVNGQKDAPDETHNGTLVFYPDGKATMIENNETSEGTWIKGNDNTITLDFNNGGGYVLNIITSAKKSQVWRSDAQEIINGATYRMVLTFYLTR